jgi:mono/diheme cytochrome c family protein
MRRFCLVFVLAVAVVVLAACGGGGEAESSSEVLDVGDPEAGREIYNTGGASAVPCVTCHSLDGTELVGPSFKGISERAGERVEGMDAVDYLHQSIVDPSAYVVEGYEDVMNKTYEEQLSEEDINNVIAFLMTQ